MLFSFFLFFFVFEFDHVRYIAAVIHAMCLYFFFFMTNLILTPSYLSTVLIIMYIFFLSSQLVYIKKMSNELIPIVPTKDSLWQKKCKWEWKSPVILFSSTFLFYFISSYLSNFCFLFPYGFLMKEV